MLAVITVVLIIRKKESNSDTSIVKISDLSVTESPALPKNQDSRGLVIQFDVLQALSPEEEAQLVEIKDKQLIAKIDNVIPGTLQAIANSEAAKGAHDVVEQTGKLYRAIIPNGAGLDKSRSMEGAFRASYRDLPNQIKGDANLVPIDTTATKGLAAVSTVNAVMNVASMAVGQYYMAQIYGQLNGIKDGVDRIAHFQKNEYKSKVQALATDVQNSSTFQMETIENNELRNRELSHLKTLEHECAELLNQANNSLQDNVISKKTLDFECYKKLVDEAQPWFQFQHLLLQIMWQIADLTYVLNLGAISRENSFALLATYAKETSSIDDKLIAWHKSMCQQLKINVDRGWRERQWFNKVVLPVLPIPALLEFHYIDIPKRTVRLIKEQTADLSEISLQADDLFHKDVQFIAKDGALYCLPSSSKK